MSAIPYERREDEWDGYEDEEPGALPRRPRRQLFTRASAALLAVLLGAAGFYAGVRVEKNQLSNSTATTGGTAGGLASALARVRGAGAAGAGTGAAGAAGAGAAGASAAGSGAAGASGAASSSGGAGGAGRFGGFGGGGGGGSLGTVSSVNGNTIYLTESSGNVVKVQLSSVTKVTKNLGVSKKSIHPGDTLVVQGLTGSKGTITATSVSDSGARAGAGAGAGAGGGGGGSGSSGGSGSAAVNSLFGGG